MPSTKKKKVESRSTEPDGSKVHEVIVEETHPDGTKTITTTTTKTYVKKKVLKDGTSIMENVTSTTTTTRECSKPVDDQRGMVEALAGDAVQGFMGFFTSPNTVTAKCQEGGGCDNAAHQDDGDGDDIDSNIIDYDDDDRSKATAGTRDTTYQNNDHKNNRQHRVDRQRRRYSGANTKPSNRRRGNATTRATTPVVDYRDDKSLDVSTLGGWTTDSKLSYDESGSRRTVTPIIDTRWKSNGVSKIPVDAQWTGGGGGGRQQQQQQQREVVNSTPQSHQYQQQQQQQHQQQHQHRQQTVNARATPSSFFQKTHPSQNQNQYSSPGGTTMIRGNNDSNNNNNNNNYQQHFQQYPPDHNTFQVTNIIDMDSQSINTGTGNSYRLYESNRFNQQLPTFHKVHSSSGNVSGSSNGDIRPKVDTMARVGRTPNNNPQPSSSNKSRRNGVRSMTPTQRRTYSNTSNANDVNRNTKLGISSSSRGRDSRAKSTSRLQRGSRNRGDDPNALDAEVLEAIDIMRQRNKSPLRNRGRLGRKSKKKQQQQQSSAKTPGLTIHSPAASVPSREQAVVRQPSPMIYDAASRQSPYGGQYQQQQQVHQHDSPLHRAAYNSPGGYSAPPQQVHQHDSSLHRAAYNSPGGCSAPPMATVPRTPGRPGAAAAVVDFDGLPLGHLANPIEWDDGMSEMRDDYPATPGRMVQAQVNPASTPGSGGHRVRVPTPTDPATHATRTSTRTKKTRGRSQSSRLFPNKQSSATDMKHRSKSVTNAPSSIPPATLVKHNQSLLPPHNSVSVKLSPPNIAVHKTSAILTSDKFVHFYSYQHNHWVQTTTVALQNTQNISLAMSESTSVIGVPYDRNSKGMLTGSVYIFERDDRSNTWYQVKKIVPKKVQEYATVGYCVDICDNVVVIGSPELGANTGGGGSVYVYQRVEPFKWVPMGRMSMNLNNHLPIPVGGLMMPPPARNFGTIVALRSNIMVVSNYQPSANGYSPSSDETSVYIYEYDPTLTSKWRLIQADLLGTEGQRRNFGSHIALTSDGEGIFIGCHSKVNPTEILYFRRSPRADIYGSRLFQLAQIVTIAEQCDIANFRVDHETDNLIIGTLNSNRVYVYQQMFDLNTMESQGWKIVCKVMVNNTVDKFGSNVGLFGDTVLVGSRDNVYSYSLENWMAARKNKRLQVQQQHPKSKSSNTALGMMRMRSSPNRLRSSSPATRSRSSRFMSSLSPMRFRS